MDLELHPAQSGAFLTTATEVLYGGAAGGGKSHLMRVAAIAWCVEVPLLQVYIFRRLSDDLIKNHMEGHTGFPALLAPWVARGLVTIRTSPASIEFNTNGAKIFLCHCQYEKDVVKYQGAQIGVLMLDELTHFTQAIYRYLRGRCRLGGLPVPDRYRGLFPRVLCGSNPGGVGHGWVKQTFIDGVAPLEVRQMPPTEGGMRRQYIPARLEDNPSMAESDPNYEASIEGLGNPALVRAMRDGDWNIVLGGMFDDVWHEPVHAVMPFEVPGSWRVDRAFDWGSSKPFSVGWWAESDGSEVELANGRKRTFPRGTLFRIAEWYGWNGKANEGLRMSDSGIAAGIRKREAELGIANRVQAGPADSAIFDEVNGDSPAAIQQRGGVRWEKANKAPGTRKRGWALIRGRLMASLSPRMEEPGLFVFNTCRQFIRTVPMLPRSTLDPDDVDTDAEDHVGDETRYRLLAMKQIASVAPLRMGRLG